MTGPWWTPADQAELDLLTRELADVSFLHRERCPDCALRRELEDLPCPPMLDAIAAVVGWYERRGERSRAVYLVAREVASFRRLRREAEALLGEEAA